MTWRRPASVSPLRTDLLLLGLGQDIAHNRDKVGVPLRRERLDRHREAWFRLSINGRLAFYPSNIEGPYQPVSRAVKETFAVSQHKKSLGRQTITLVDHQRTN